MWVCSKTARRPEPRLRSRSEEYKYISKIFRYSEAGSHQQEQLCHPYLRQVLPALQTQCVLQTVCFYIYSYKWHTIFVNVNIVNIFRRANFLLSHNEETSDISETENCKTDKKFSLTRIVLEIICLGELTHTTWPICDLILLQLFCWAWCLWSSSLYSSPGPS